jgi:hypothetical protein
MTDGSSGLSVLVDDHASAEEISRVQAVFSRLGLDATIEASLQRKGAGDFPWLLLIEGSVGLFVTAFAKQAGTGAGELFTTWLKDLYGTRKGRNGTVIVRQQEVPEILLSPDLPAEAWADLADLVDSDGFTDIPGDSQQIRYEPGQGWTRPW